MAHEFLQHIELGHCEVISAAQFHGHIVHKHLITELLKGGEALARFQQKQAKYEAALDCEEDGGVGLEEEIFEDEGIEEVKYDALKPDTPPDTPLSPVAAGPFPPLPSQARTTPPHQFDFETVSNMAYDLEADLVSLCGGLSMDGISLSGASAASIVVNSPVASPVAGDYIHSCFSIGSGRQAPSTVESAATGRQVSSTIGSTSATSNRQPKVWGSRSGKTTSEILFPAAKANPAPKEFSIEASDKTTKEENFNIMKTHFWDPMSSDWNPERWFDAILGKYYCPFTCE